MDPHPQDPAYHEGVELIALIRVGAIQVPVFSKPDLANGDSDNSVGQSVYYPYTHILIDSLLGPQIRAMTMMHELFHVMSDCGGFSLTEKQVEGLEHGFAQLVQDNPVIMNRVFEGLKRRDVPNPVLACLKKPEESQMPTPSLDDRGVNLN